MLKVEKKKHVENSVFESTIDPKVNISISDSNSTGKGQDETTMTTMRTTITAKTTTIAAAAAAAAATAEASSSNPNVLHEVILNKFNRTTTGRVYQKDLKDIYAMLIIELDLKKDATVNRCNLQHGISSSLSKVKFIKLSKSFPYSFYMSTAIEKMNQLSLKIESTKTVTLISYSFKPALAETLIREFYKAKFLHSPADRTRGEPKSSVALQPTPKGLSIVQTFCVKQGLPKSSMPEVLFHNEYNTMQLFAFERDHISDKLVYSDNLVELLFSALLGPSPNFWSPTNKPDKIRVSKKKHNDEVFDYNIADFQFSGDYLSLKQVNTNFSVSTIGEECAFSFSKYQNTCHDLTQNPYDSETTSNILQSPFYHRYFENPKSDAHMQYYISSVGVRLLREKTASRNGNLQYCISGKAIYQWLMDCSDVVCPKEALEICSLFLKQNLMAPLESDGGKEENYFSRSKYFKLTTFGLQVSRWGKPSQQERILTPQCIRNRDGSKKISKFKIPLAEILKDPGTKLQFRKHLEREFCSENFDAYCQLEIFNSKVSAYLNAISSNKVSEITAEDVKQSIATQQKTCMSMAYQIFNTFISTESSSVVNIEYRLRMKIVNLLTRLTMEQQQEIDGNDDESVKYLTTPTDTITMSGITYSPSSETIHSDNDLTESELNQKSDPSKILREINTLFEQVKIHMYKLMEVDSLPKFLNNFGYWKLSC
ncbi:SST2 [Candida oxycetoniae]|uniref:SST2 n=1 Tax=Candida oxycetoniae TaxID=497107 RepID=A0AAI9WXM4_9ASCO|nr:SST2 [Candida oxycetoniae]KAI3404154.2 SST2 [Candida oxycetoniae]